jgi:copper resistance protein B
MNMRLWSFVATFTLISGVRAQGTSEQEHVPPDPPTAQVDHSMPYEAMARMMEMDDRSTFGKVMLDRLEWRNTERGSAFEWNADAWYGNDYDKIWLKAEGKRHAGETESARTELLWSHTLTRWWNLQSGVRHDSPSGASRNWAALGVQGLAPGFIDVEATVYVADQGRAAARIAAERDFLFTQRLILQPELELNAYAHDDAVNHIGSGLSELEVGLRLRYEPRREFATYLGLAWTRHFGATESLLRSAGNDSQQWQALAGLRMWF